MWTGSKQTRARSRRTQMAPSLLIIRSLAQNCAFSKSSRSGTALSRDALATRRRAGREAQYINSVGVARSSGNREGGNDRLH